MYYLFISAFHDIRLFILVRELHKENNRRVIDRRL